MRESVHVSTSTATQDTRPFIFTSKSENAGEDFRSPVPVFHTNQIGETLLLPHRRRQPTSNDNIGDIGFPQLYIAGQRPPLKEQRFTGPLFWHASTTHPTSSSPPLPQRASSSEIESSSWIRLRRRQGTTESRPSTP
ncbi:hypothetical protein Rs2_41875 [Raphanus sativus]|nr:hypothetical protein Rs2_41875 [Raphanus sativus]